MTAALDIPQILCNLNVKFTSQVSPLCVVLGIKVYDKCHDAIVLPV